MVFTEMDRSSDVSNAREVQNSTRNTKAAVRVPL